MGVTLWRSKVQRAAMHTHSQGLCRGICIMVCPASLCPDGPMSLGAARPTALWWDGGVFLIPIQAGQRPATNTRAKTEPGHNTSASSNLPPAPAARREGRCPVGLGVEAQGDGSQHSCPRPRAEGWQWGRAGGSGTRQEDVNSCVTIAPHHMQLPQHPRLPCPDVLPAAGPWQRVAQHKDQPPKRPPPAGPCSRAAQPRSPRTASCRLQCLRDARLPQLSKGQRAQ